jgi:Copper amine oxidase N-terminal domain/N-acetylmuramoyl-L-alanine amidase
MKPSWMKPSWIVLHHYVSNNGEPIEVQHHLANIIRDKHCSYHYIVFSDGSYWLLNDPSKAIGHCGTNSPLRSKNKKTSNYNSIAVCVTGNFETGQMKEPRKNGVIRLLAKLCHDLEINPSNIIKHRDVWATACPGKNYPYLEIIDEVKRIVASSLIITPGEKVVMVGDELIYLEKEPTTLWGVAVFPLRELFEILGFEISWNQKEKKIVAKSVDYEINLWSGEKRIVINGREETLSHEVINLWGTNVVPLRSILEKMGYTVNWLPVSKQIQAVRY